MNTIHIKLLTPLRNIMEFCIPFILITVVSISGCSNSNPVESKNDEENGYQDMLTPVYYNSDNNDPFKIEVNNFLEQVRKIEFHHPLESVSGRIPSFTVPANGEFGAPKGTIQHHAAVDLHIENNETEVVLYASHDGIVRTEKDAAKYRHYLSITKEIRDSSNQIIGKLVTLYGHIDLDLDEAEGLSLNGQFVSVGDTVSKHLYSGTVGGPHLHFEIRYYRSSDDGNEEFYGSKTAERTEHSAGQWSYGYWNPNVGYGYGNPENHSLNFYGD